jgi:RimJ/RimL family protein N-acetyltransferase
MIEDIFDHNIVLENERALLRPLQLSDVEYFIPFVIAEPTLWRYSLDAPTDVSSMERYVTTAIQNRIEHKEYAFIIFDKKANAYAGSTRFYDIQQQFQTTQLGYTWYGKDYQQTGLNRHCKLLLFGFAFEQWGMERVELRADIRNDKSIKAMKAIGCVPEGIRRSHLPNNEGGRRDSIVLSILKDEWFDGGKEMLIKKIK